MPTGNIFTQEVVGCVSKQRKKYSSHLVASLREQPKTFRDFCIIYSRKIHNKASL